MGVDADWSVVPEPDDCVGEADDREHLEEEDAEVDEVVGAQFVGERGVEEHVAEREEGRIHRVPVAVDDPGPLVRAQIVANVHVGDGVAVDLVGVVECVAEGDCGGEDAVDGKEAAKESGLAGVGCGRLLHKLIIAEGSRGSWSPLGRKRESLISMKDGTCWLRFS